MKKINDLERLLIYLADEAYMVICDATIKMKAYEHYDGRVFLTFIANGIRALDIKAKEVFKEEYDFGILYLLLKERFFKEDPYGLSFLMSVLESIDVEERMNYTSEQRKKIPPFIMMSSSFEKNKEQYEKAIKDFVEKFFNKEAK